MNKPRRHVKRFKSVAGLESWAATPALVLARFAGQREGISMRSGGRWHALGCKRTATDVVHQHPLGMTGTRYGPHDWKNKPDHLLAMIRPCHQVQEALARAKK